MIASRSQTDTEIIAAIGMAGYRGLYIDRSNPYRYQLIATDDADTPGSMGRVILAEDIEGRGGRWILGCIECGYDIAGIDEGICAECRGIGSAIAGRTYVVLITGDDGSDFSDSAIGPFRSEAVAEKHRAYYSEEPWLHVRVVQLERPENISPAS
jgi:hypothetical protein